MCKIKCYASAGIAPVPNVRSVLSRRYHPTYVVCHTTNTQQQQMLSIKLRSSTTAKTVGGFSRARRGLVVRWRSIRPPRVRSSRSVYVYRTIRALRVIIYSSSSSGDAGPSPRFRFFFLGRGVASDSNGRVQLGRSGRLPPTQATVMIRSPFLVWWFGHKWCDCTRLENTKAQCYVS